MSRIRRNSAAVSSSRAGDHLGKLSGLRSAVWSEAAGGKFPRAAKANA